MNTWVYKTFYSNIHKLEKLFRVLVAFEKCVGQWPGKVKAAVFGLFISSNDKKMKSGC